MSGYWWTWTTYTPSGNVITMGRFDNSPSPGNFVPGATFRVHMRVTDLSGNYAIATSNVTTIVAN